MARDFEASSFCDGSTALGLQKSAVDYNVEVDRIAGAVHHEFENLLFGGPGGTVAKDGYVSVPTDFRERSDARGVYGFLYVRRIVRLHLAEHSDGFKLGVGTVAVVAKFNARAGGLAGGGGAFDVELGIESDLDFEGLETQGDGAFDFIGDLVRWFGAHPITSLDPIAVLATDEVVDGLVRCFSNYVPKGLIDRSGDVQCGRCAGVKEVAEFRGDLAGEIHPSFDRVDVVRIAANQSGLDLFKEALVTTGSDTSFTQPRDAFVSVDEEDRLDGGEARAVPHRYRLVLTERGKRNADVARADVGDFHWEYSHGLMISTG